MNKFFMANEVDFERFKKVCIALEDYDKPEKYPCVAVYHNYEDWNARDWTDVEFVYLDDFED